LPGGKLLSFACPKESNQRRKAPSAALLRSSLRCSTSRAAAELASLRQSSPKSPDWSVLLGAAARDFVQVSPFPILNYENLIFITEDGKVTFRRFSFSPDATLSSAGKAGVFGEHCLSSATRRTCAAC
jgi:hypothetical protein